MNGDYGVIGSTRACGALCAGSSPASHNLRTPMELVNRRVCKTFDAGFDPLGVLHL